MSQDQYDELDREAKQSGKSEIMKNVEIEQELSKSFYFST